MIRGKWLLMLCSIILAAACTGQSTPTGNVADTPDNRKAAAKRYLEAVPPQELLNNITGNMARRLPEATRKRFQKAMADKDLLKNTYNISEKGLVKHFTPDELNAMTTFFGSPAGKSARNKFSPYMRDIMPQVNKEVRTVIAKMQEEEKKEQPKEGAPGAAKPKAEPGKPAPAKPVKPETPQPQPEKSKAKQPQPQKSQTEHPHTEHPQAGKPKPEQPQKK